MTNTTQLPNDMLQIVIDRANDMLKNAQIAEIYNSHKTEDEAKEWLIKAAVATLIIKVEDRK